ncbi:Protein MOS2 [Dichanthelium oligosanthes]|uniref:Protein MOS2 n=1 Tax=Dichanthelium oligosanthes TaxID=888268 RepID=A0A1E5V648_9POAL|nr:Protein MOS2 [Dichanthelium oligosanthes]
MEKEKKLSFSISSSKQRPPKPPSRPAAADDDEAGPGSASSPAQQFVTEFDPSQTLAASGAPRAVIAPLPNSGNFLTHRPRKPSSLPTPEEEAALAAESGGGGPSFVLDTSTAPDDPSSSIAYGLTVRNGATEATAAKESEKAPPPPPAPPAAADATPAGDLMLRRYKEDMASLPDHRGIDEFNEMPVEGFGAALLAGYGWTEGKGIGRNNKTGDAKVVEYDRRAGTQGLGYNPSEADPRKTRSGDWIVGEKKALENGSAKKRDRNSRDRVEERDSSARKKRSGEQRSEKEARGKERNGQDSREGTSNGSDARSKVRWLQSHIRVRVVSEKLSKRLYLMKGKVVDVVGPTTCDVMMDDGSELVQGVEQDMLETVLPRTNGRVLVLYGKHKGTYGHLVEKNSEEEIGLVEDADTKDMVRVRYDQMAEYTGDPELLGY